MREQGIIISTKGEQATIEINRGAKCGGCRACHTFGESKMRLEARNALNARVGDAVEVEVQPGNVIKNSLLIFILPLLMMGVGYFVGLNFAAGTDESAGILGAFAALFLSLLFLRILEKRRAPRPDDDAVVVRRLDES